MQQKELNLANKYDDFYPKNYHKNKSQEKEKEKKQEDGNKPINNNTIFKEYIPKKRMLNQQVHPLQTEKESYYPKYQSKYYNEKYTKKKIKNKK